MTYTIIVYTVDGSHYTYIGALDYTYGSESVVLRDSRGVKYIHPISAIQRISIEEVQ